MIKSTALLCQDLIVMKPLVGSVKGAPFVTAHGIPPPYPPPFLPNCFIYFFIYNRLLTLEMHCLEMHYLEMFYLGMFYFIDPRYEWSIFSVSNFQTPAKPASDWLKSQLLIG